MYAINTVYYVIKNQSKIAHTHFVITDTLRYLANHRADMELL